MYQIKTMNKISPKGLVHLDADRYTVGDDFTNENAILVRSAKLHEYDFPSELLTIARAGAGVNNIPLDRCAEAGIVVFNTPGANANAVKELAVTALLLASRNIVGGIEWVKEQANSGIEVSTVVEKGKAAFAGQEITGKTLGVVGLGAIGLLFANAAVSLGMKVVGYDPFLSVSSALALSPEVTIADNVEDVYAAADYLSLHLPMTPDTKESINASVFAQMKDGARIINLARAELVNDDDLLVALESGKIAYYVTDFPNSKVATAAGVAPIPHLGASTNESEENCAEMAALQVKDYLENGNIKNSVNLPNLTQAWKTNCRVCVLTGGGANLLSDLSARLSGIAATSSQSKGDYTYMLFDLNDAASDDVVNEIKAMENVLRVRVLTK